VYPGPPSLEEPTALQQCVGMSGAASQNIFGSLLGTGFDGAAVSSNDTVSAISGGEYIYGGGSGWLTTSFGVTPSEELQIRFVLMDTFYGLKDSVLLVDALGWDESPETGGVSRPPK